ncbi:MAG: phosphoglycolate phosphatase, partial [Cycloclasticus sp.]|nr:phosphoglycolate phosphatase [Cycloclasticus sp.]
MSVAINDWQVGAVLFDLDGTLVDTAPDLATALNVALVQNNQAVLPYETIRPIVSNGANGLI